MTYIQFIDIFNIKSTRLFVCGPVTIAMYFQALTYRNQLRHILINLVTILEVRSTSGRANSLLFSCIISVLRVLILFG